MQLFNHMINNINIIVNTYNNVFMWLIFLNCNIYYQ